MLRVNTFGGLAVSHSERRVSGAAAQPRRLAILALLARAGQRGVSRDRVIVQLWPDEDDERARKTLAEAIHGLSGDLGSDTAIVGTHDLRLNPDVLSTDIGEFGACVKDGRLEQAAQLYTGPFLQGFHLSGAPEFERWADDERTALSHEHVALLERIAAAAEGAEEYAAAVEWRRKLCGVDPLNARFAVALMRAFEKCGDRAGALKHARLYEALATNELELPADRAVTDYAAELRAAPANSGTQADAERRRQNEERRKAEQRKRRTPALVLPVQPPRFALSRRTIALIVAALAFATTAIAVASR